MQPPLQPYSDNPNKPQERETPISKFKPRRLVFAALGSITVIAAMSIAGWINQSTLTNVIIVVTVLILIIVLPAFYVFVARPLLVKCAKGLTGR